MSFVLAVLLLFAPFVPPSAAIRLYPQQINNQIVQTRIEVTLYKFGSVTFDLDSSPGITFTALTSSVGDCAPRHCETFGEINQTVVLTSTAVFSAAGDHVLGVAVRTADDVGTIKGVAITTAYRCYLPIQTTPHESP